MRHVKSNKVGEIQHVSDKGRVIKGLVVMGRCPVSNFNHLPPITVRQTLPRKDAIHLRFLSDLENPEHHPLVMGCNTLTPKDIRLSNIQQTTNPLIT